MFGEAAMFLVHPTFDVCETTLELPHRGTQRGLGVDAVVTRHVDERVEGVTELRLDLGRISADHRAVELRELLVDLRARPSRVRPVEPDPAHLLADPLGSHERW